MKVLALIPARYASTRLPGKPLVPIGGKTMIHRVYNQVLQSALIDKVVVATDDERIVQEVKNFGGNVILTSPTHESGTDRCAEVAQQFPKHDVIINIQGDEPFIDPAQIDLLISCFEQANTKLATLVKVIKNKEELLNVNIPKVVLDHEQNAIYFSRQTIPHLRNIEPEEWINNFTFYKHIGIYGYLRTTLLEITKLTTSTLEEAEKLEQLRWIENGYKINTRVTIHESLAIDTPNDLELAIKKLTV